MTITNRAGELADELQHSQLAGNAKSTLLDTKERLAGVDRTNFKLMNFFSVFSLSILLFSTLFPLTRVMGSSINVSEVTPSWLYILAILALCSHLFGAMQLLSRSLMVILLVAIGFTIYQQLAETIQVAHMFGRIRIDDGLTIALKVFSVGFYLFMVSFILVFIATLKPGYKTNSAFWGKLIKA